VQHEPTGVGLGKRLHKAYGPARRVRVLCEHFEPMIPDGATLLDVGCGDGAIDARLAEQRSDLDVRGLDVCVREGARIPVEPFDGRTIPYDDDGVDVVLMADVLHHVEDPEHLLGEAARVARQCVLIKDHLVAGPFANSLLNFMDQAANRRYGLTVYEYWPERRWREAFERLGLTVEAWSDRIHLYPAPADWIFGRSLHFVAKLAAQVPSPETVSSAVTNG
jgi:SAM-dependent methyltransferase